MGKVAQATQTLVTAEEFAQLPDDDKRRELARGLVIEMPLGGAEHSVLSVSLAVLLVQVVRADRLGVVVGADCGFVLARDPDVVRAPDAAFIARNRLPGGRPPKGFFEGAPDLAVEVVSLSDTASEIEARVAEYLAAGASVVWVVYPDGRRVWVHRSLAESFVLREGDTLTGDPVLPGLAIPIADIFAR